MSTMVIDRLASIVFDSTPLVRDGQRDQGNNESVHCSDKAVRLVIKKIKSTDQEGTLKYDICICRQYQWYSRLKVNQQQ